MSRLKLIRYFLFALLAGVLYTATAQNFPGVLTWHNDIARTGQNLQETQLTPASVNSKTFGKLFSYPVQGQIYAQPLYVPNVQIQGQGSHNVVYVVTEHDQVYAFDADGSSSQPLWQTSFIDPSKGITPYPTQGDSCDSLQPEVGITSTPVIDAVSGTMYIVAETAENGAAVQRLHALDITSGAEKFGGPVLIQATANKITFDARSIQRTGLLLLNGTVYFAHAYLCAPRAYHGWVFGYDAQTLSQTSVFITTPNGDKGGIWQSGAGLASDGKFIFLMDGDGTFDASKGGNDYGMCAMKLKIRNGNISVADYFAPSDQKKLSREDLDLGSGGLLLLPKQAGSHPQEMIGASKTGDIWVFDRNHLGKFHSKSDDVVQELQGSANGYRSSPAYWQQNIYYSGNHDYLDMYSIQNGLLSAQPVSHSPETYPTLGATPSISANGNANGIVWTVEVAASNAPAVLHAYDATDLSKELYNSKQAGKRDTAGLGNKFQIPTITNGKVYVGTQTELDVYGIIGK